MGETEAFFGASGIGATAAVVGSRWGRRIACARDRVGVACRQRN